MDFCFRATAAKSFRFRDTPDAGQVQETIPGHTVLGQLRFNRPCGVVKEYHSDGSENPTQTHYSIYGSPRARTARTNIDEKRRRSLFQKKRAASQWKQPCIGFALSIIYFFLETFFSLRILPSLNTRAVRAGRYSST